MRLRPSVSPAWLRFCGVVLVGAALAAAASQAPHVLRRFDAFSVRHVELHGLRFLPPHEALAASGVTHASNVFDSPAAITARLRQHRLVANAHVGRRLPATLVVTVREVEPVALIRGDPLRAVDALGRVLPIDPASMPLDLPLVWTQGPNAGAAADAAVVAVLTELTRLSRFEPALALRVSEAEQAGPDALRLRLREPTGAIALLARPVEPLPLRQLLLALADLESRNELLRLARIDARFRDQIVISLQPRGG
ncbi:MAG: cell division protein FtsQ/DivIB [Longimicrobiales bacterium]